MNFKNFWVPRYVEYYQWSGYYNILLYLKVVANILVLFIFKALLILMSNAVIKFYHSMLKTSM